MGDTRDVVVVGSGAGGGPVAYELARAGVDVLLLEKGVALGAKDLTHDELKFCRSNLLQPEIGDEPHVLERVGHQPQLTSDGWIANCVGGGTVHMSGFFLRLKPDDFRTATLYGRVSGASLADWPLSYAEFEPAYDVVERVIGVSGRAGINPFEEPRRYPFLMRPLAEHSIGRDIDEACGKLGYHPFPTPRAILSEPRSERGGCSYCALCAGYGCEMGAKGSTAASVIPAAVATGNCEVRPGCMVHTVEIDRRGRVTGVVYFDSAGEEQRVLARTVVVSCSAIESARLLLNSSSEAFPHGLGNHNGLVGRNLTFSTGAGGGAHFSRSTAAVRSWLRSDESPFVHRCVQDFYKNAAADIPIGGTLSFLLTHPNPIARAVGVATGNGKVILGDELKAALRKDMRDTFHLGFEVFGESVPTEGSYVTLDPTVRDRWDIPVARIVWEPHPWDNVAALAVQARGMEILNALRPDHLSLEEPGPAMILQHGTCRFGTNPDASVLDSECRSHSVPNLWVVDGSFMPNVGGVPPTWTIMANGFRVGMSMARAFRRREIRG